MDRVITPEGRVALFYFQPIPKMIMLGGDKGVYFDCQHGVSLAFVDESDVPTLLGLTGGCCGGKRQIVYLATPTQYEHWKTGNGR